VSAYFPSSLERREGGGGRGPINEGRRGNKNRFSFEGREGRGKGFHCFVHLEREEVERIGRSVLPIPAGGGEGRGKKAVQARARSMEKKGGWRKNLLGLFLRRKKRGAW